MNLDEMKLAVCEKLPELVCINPTNKMIHWQLNEPLKIWHEEVRWSTEGLQVCHEAEKLVNWFEYDTILCKVSNLSRPIEATYEQRLEALCRVWWPERFN